MFCLLVFRTVCAYCCVVQAITFPLLLCQGSDDAFVSPSGAEWVYKRSLSNDKKIKRYRGGYHDLLNDSIREQVRVYSTPPVRRPSPLSSYPPTSRMPIYFDSRTPAYVSSLFLVHRCSMTWSDGWTSVWTFHNPGWSELN